MQNIDVVIVGGGFTGLSAAYDLTRQGQKVLVLEADAELGGLGGSFEVSPGIRLEKFYHHWFTSDLAILQLIDELGLSKQVQRLPSQTGLYYANQQFRLASPLDLLRFKPLPLIDRIRTGLMALRARAIKNWKILEGITAEDWIKKVGGRRGFDVIWKPLLSGKFGPEASHVSAVWFWNKLKLRGSSRGSKGREELLYFKGGFQGVTDALRRSIEQGGGQVRCNAEVAEILVEGSEAQGVRLKNGEVMKAAKVLVTVPLPIFLKLAPTLPQQYRDQLGKIRFLGNVCLILRLKRSLSETYWLNVADPTFPFVGVIEHTNLDSPSNYGGERIAYLSKYLPTSEPLFGMSDTQVFEYALPFIQRMFPEFRADWVSGYAVWRAHFSQPVVVKNYSKLIPSFQTPMKGLWLSSMAQIYPEDRGTNYAVQYGRAVAAQMMSA